MSIVTQKVTHLIGAMKTEGLTLEIAAQTDILLSELDSMIADGASEYGGTVSTSESRSYEQATMARQSLVNALDTCTNIRPFEVKRDYTSNDVLRLTA